MSRRRAAQRSPQSSTWSAPRRRSFSEARSPTRKVTPSACCESDQRPVSWILRQGPTKRARQIRALVRASSKASSPPGVATARPITWTLGSSRTLSSKSPLAKSSRQRPSPRHQPIRPAGSSGAGSRGGAAGGSAGTAGEAGEAGAAGGAGAAPQPNTNRSARLRRRIMGTRQDRGRVADGQAGAAAWPRPREVGGRRMRSGSGAAAAPARGQRTKDAVQLGRGGVAPPSNSALQSESAWRSKFSVRTEWKLETGPT